MMTWLIVNEKLVGWGEVRTPTVLFMAQLGFVPHPNLRAVPLLINH